MQNLRFPSSNHCLCPALACLMASFCLLLSGAFSKPLLAQEEETGFRPLFDGKSLTGWYGNDPHKTARVAPAERDAFIAAQQVEFQTHWRAEDGELVNDGYGPYATTEQDFGDIELQLDYKTVAKADSGIYLRGTPQIQIWDYTEEGGKWDRHADKGSGGLFNNRKGMPGQLPLVLADKPFGQWNHFRILQIGSRTWVELNEKLVVDGAIMENFWDKEGRSPLPVSGPIQLQTHGGEIRWRNIIVRDIDVEEAISRLRGDDAKFGFAPIFNGRDLTGWAGAVDDYEVVDGAIACKAGRGGVLFTEETYDDFIVRLEFKLPPGGNNGLTIRYPGHGQPPYDGMCELQILDDDAEQYAGLDPRQYHGSVYGIVAAHRGYLRPAGEWNYQEVTVQGSTIKVELNGSVIVDADVSKVTEFKDNLKHPGVGRTSGHFGFAGHNDPVMFRNIAIKPLLSDKSKQAAQQRRLKSQLQAGMIFHASFDDVTDANLSTGDGWIQTAESLDRKQVRPQNQIESTRIAKGAGRYGDALQFTANSKQVLFYEGQECGYRTEDWSGAVSLWLKLDPNKDLQPGFCDPLQITQRGWNDAAFFIDFDKDLPRDFRLGVFPDYATWNPKDTEWDDIPPAKRPMVTVKQPPFSAQDWTHVCFTWDGVNSVDGTAAKAALYLNGELQGTLERPMKFSWDPKQVGMMLGINYIGLMDDLMLFNRALTPAEIKLLYQLPAGGVR